MASMFKKDKSKIRVINRCQYVINPITPGLFWRSNPWGRSQSASPSITQERNMET